MGGSDAIETSPDGSAVTVDAPLLRGIMLLLDI